MTLNFIFLNNGWKEEEGGSTVASVRIPISVGHFSLVLPPNDQKLSQNPAIHCPQTGLVLLYALEVVAAYSLTCSQVQNQGVTIKQILTCPTNGQKVVHPSLHAAYQSHRCMM